MTVQRAPIQQQISSFGEVRAQAQVTVQPRASGHVQRVLVDTGAQVHAGDVLAQLETDALQIAVLQARANLAAAQASSWPYTTGSA